MKDKFKVYYNHKRLKEGKDYKIDNGELVFLKPFIITEKDLFKLQIERDSEIKWKDCN